MIIKLKKTSDEITKICW